MSINALSVVQFWERSGAAAPVREQLELAAVRMLARRRNARVPRFAWADADAGYPELHKTFRDALGYDLDL